MTAAEQVFLSSRVSQVDPFCREFFENPFPAHEELREAGPVVWLSRYGVWAVARYEQVHAVLSDWQTFCSGRGAWITDFAREKAWRPKSLVLETDPPLHDRSRRVLNRVLSASVMSRLRERFAEEANRLVDDLLDRGRFDAIADLAEAYPLAVFPDAMGMPRENRHFLLPFGNMVFSSFGPSNEFFEEAVANAESVLAWLQRQMQRDAFSPGGFGAAIHAANDTGELSQEEAPIVVRSLLTAGVDTTVSGIGAAVYCLARFPEQFARLRADPSLARAAFEEAKTKRC
jgi:4-methoxybenzoate monooxygenase (O-demethylating)